MAACFCRTVVFRLYRDIPNRTCKSIGIRIIFTKIIINRREAPLFLMRLSSGLGRIVGDFIKRESESLINNGLEFPIDYVLRRED